MFAGLNMMRYILIKNYHLPRNFELSQAYLFFWDKIEKANTFLETIIETKNNSMTDPYMQFLINKETCPLNDGGYWHSFANLVSKYGIMPQSKYDECLNTLNSDLLNKFYVKKLFGYAFQIRHSDKTEEELRKLKDSIFMNDVYSLISRFLSEPPNKFNWEIYTSKDDPTIPVKLIKMNDLTPLGFYNDLIEPEFNISGKIVLIHDPRENTKLYNTYIMRYYSNIVGKQPCSHIPVDLKTMKDAIFNSIDNDKPCWIGCDMKDFDHHKSVLDPDGFDYDITLNNKDILKNKKDQLEMKLTSPCHAMCIVGIDVKDNDLKTNCKNKKKYKYNGNCKSYKKFRVENSWGQLSNCDDGYILMTDKWFDKYMYEVVVDFDLLPEKIQDLIEDSKYNPIELEHTDPLNQQKKNNILKF